LLRKEKLVRLKMVREYQGRRMVRNRLGPELQKKGKIKNLKGEERLMRKDGAESERELPTRKNLQDEKPEKKRSRGKMTME